MRTPPMVFLGALGLAGWAGADAAARADGGGDAAMPMREVRTGVVVVQRSAATADVVMAVDGGTARQRTGSPTRVFVLQRDGAPSGDAVLRYAGSCVLYDQGTILVAPADGSPAVGLSLAGREALSPTAASFLGTTRVGDRWTGGGLALRRGEVRIGEAGLSPATMERVLARTRKDGPAPAGAPPGCPSGGSTDCSNSTCQILCVPGVHACCDCTPDPTNCKCSCVRD